MDQKILFIIFLIDYLNNKLEWGISFFSPYGYGKIQQWFAMLPMLKSYESNESR